MLLMFLLFHLMFCRRILSRVSLPCRRRIRHERRKAFQQLVEHFTALEQSFNLIAEFGTLARCQFKGNLVAGQGHGVSTSQRYYHATDNFSHTKQVSPLCKSREFILN